MTSCIPLSHNNIDSESHVHRELFVDRFFIDNMSQCRMVLHPPTPTETVFNFDRPWEGIFSGYITVIKDGDRYRMYYRGTPGLQGPNNLVRDPVTCYAESSDGVRWNRPDIGSINLQGSSSNNAIIEDGEGEVSHNFCPFIDTNPLASEEQRFKAVGGVGHGLFALSSQDGINWQHLQTAPVMSFEEYCLDSQNVAFWSDTEQCYVCYLRKNKIEPHRERIRWIYRATSPDMLHWSDPVSMNIGDHPPVDYYTNQTQPYFRAPHIYIALPARLFESRPVITPQQAKDLDLFPMYANDCSDAVLMTSRGGNNYDCEFREAFIRPAIGPQHWTSRTNYPACGIVQTGEHEMSIYVQQGFGQPTNRLVRYAMRLDGFASVQAGYNGGELLTKPFRFTGGHLSLNFATSAGGELRVEVQQANGQPISGLTLADCPAIVGNEINRQICWNSNVNLDSLKDKLIRLRFVIHDADLFAIQY